MPCFDAVTSKMARNPKGQRLLALFEDRPGDHRDLVTTASALVDHPLRRQKIPPATRAVGAAEALRPFQPSEGFSAVVFIGETDLGTRLAARKFEYVHPAPRTFAFTVCSYSVDTPNAS
jgi:hypothetical protein